MIAKLKQRLHDLQSRLGRDRAMLAKAQRRHKARRHDAKAHHDKAKRHREKADDLRDTADNRRKHGHLVQAQHFDGLAAKQARAAVAEAQKARNQQAKAQWWVARIKLLHQRIERIETRTEKVQAELNELKRKHGVTIHGNTATGGTDGQRFRAVILESVANCSKGMPDGRRNFYDQDGSWNPNHPIRPGEAYGQRSDCSETLEAWCKAAGLPDPSGLNYTGGYTGTLVVPKNGWRLATEAEMRKQGWGYVVYGGGTGHHVEAYIGPGDRTGGHGSAPVDFGVIDLFGDGDYRCYIYDPK